MFTNKLSATIKNKMSPEEILKLIFESNLTEIYPNIVISLRILLTIGISVASAERSFSKLKIIKNYLRSTMGQERLVGLATISIEAEIAYGLDIENLVETFIVQEKRKPKF